MIYENTDQNIMKRNVFQDTDRLNSPLVVFIREENPDSDDAVEPHWHYYLEIIYVMKGQLDATCDSTTYLLSPGDLILFYPQSVHSMKRHVSPECPQEQAHYFVLMMDLNFLNITNSYRTRFSKIFRLAYSKDPSYIFFPRQSLQDFPILQLMLDSREEMWNRAQGCDVIICSNFATLLTYLVRILRRRGLNTDEIITAPDENGISIHSISEYIHQHSSEPLRVQDLADRCCMSYSYFAKLFRETYNQSCKEYIEFSRLNKATDLLLFTDLDLCYISQETGFSDCSHLIRTFKKWKGITPKQWRQKMKTQDKRKD